MPSLKELKNRIASVTATQKITRAMQMVAAAKLRRAQEAMEAARPYCERMASMTGTAASALPEHEAPLLLRGNGRDETHLLVVCTADRGLCGGFNSSIARLARDRARRLRNEGKAVKIMTVGRKGYDQLRREFESLIVERIELRSTRGPGMEAANAIAERIIAMFEAEEFDVCTLFHSRFKSVIAQIPLEVGLIPAPSPSAEGAEAENGEAEGDRTARAGGGASGATASGSGARALREFEPEADALLERLAPRNLAAQLLGALLENAAGEMGAKMSAMDSATRNAGEMIERLTLNYNRQRQAQITKELIEIISGAEAL